MFLTSWNLFCTNNMKIVKYCRDVPICHDTATQRAKNFVTKFSRRVNMYVIRRCIVIFVCCFIMNVL